MHARGRYADLNWGRHGCGCACLVDEYTYFGDDLMVSTVSVHRPRKFPEAEFSSVPDQLNLHGPLPVVVIIGGASNLDRPSDNRVDEAELKRIRDSIEKIMMEALRPAVLQGHAVVLSGGTDTGVMRLAGLTLADAASALIGVVPATKVTGDRPEAHLDANHTAAVLTSGLRWGSETEVLFNMAEALTGGVAPGVVVLANGGPVSFEEARRFLRGGWPILSVSGSGGAAQELLDAVKHSDRSSRWGDLLRADVEPLDQDPSTARRQLMWRLHEDGLLKSAWATFASYDEKARLLKDSSKRTRQLLTGLSSALLVAVTMTVQLAVLGWTAPGGLVSPHINTDRMRSVLSVVLTVSKWAVLAIPIGIAVAAALGSFSGSQMRWRAVRSSAETLKREIYRYRSRKAVEPDEAGRRLAAVLHVVDAEAIRANIGLAETPPGLIRGRPANVDLDELEVLNARIYLKRRLEHQVLWFGSAARRRRRGEWAVVVAGAFSASVAMALVNTRYAAWIAILVLSATVFAFSRERGSTRQQIAGFDRAIAGVNDAWVAWLQRTADDRMEASALAELVDAVEDSFEAENLSWSEVMRRAAQQTSGTQSLGLGA